MQIYYRLSDFVREVKYAYQRVNRGYDDRMMWSLDYGLNDIIIPVLKNLRENHCGYPSEMTNEKWEKELDMMIAGFEASKRMLDLDYDYKKEYKKLEASRIKGMSSFVKHYHNLWD